MNDRTIIIDSVIFRLIFFKMTENNPQVDKRLDAIEANVAKIMTGVDSMQSQISSMQSQISSIQSKISSMQTSTASIESVEAAKEDILNAIGVRILFT